MGAEAQVPELTPAQLDRNFPLARLIVSDANGPAIAIRERATELGNASGLFNVESGDNPPRGLWPANTVRGVTLTYFWATAGDPAAFDRLVGAAEASIEVPATEEGGAPTRKEPTLDEALVTLERAHRELVDEKKKLATSAPEVVSPVARPLIGRLPTDKKA